MKDNGLIYLDQINRADDARAGLALSQTVTINDVTLREACQVVRLGLPEKLEIAHALIDLGLPRIQVGIPGVSEVDRQVISHLKQERVNAKLEAVCFLYDRDWKRSLDTCIESGADSIDLFQTVSDDKLRIRGETLEEVAEKCIEAISYAKSQGVEHVAFCPFSANRTDFARFTEIMEWSEAAGADMILVTDTYGTSSPTAMYWFVRNLKQRSSIPLGIHCHNDLGLALANTLAAIEAGAEWAEASVNGLGDRTGNCSLDELVVALEGFYDFDLALNTEKLYSLSRLVEKTTAIPLPFGKPLVGDNAFVHRHDDDARGSLMNSGSTVPIEPNYVGNERRIELGGEYTGPFMVQAKASALGIDIPDCALHGTVSAIRKELADNQSPLSDEKFANIVLECLRNKSLHSS